MPWTSGQVLTAALLNQYVPQGASVTQVASSSDLTLTGTVTQIPGLSVVASGAGTSSRYIISASLDLSILNADNQVGWNLYVDTVVNGAASIIVASGVSRATSSRTFYVTGLTAGSHTFTIRANMTGTAGGSIVRATNSTLIVDARG